MEILVDSYRDFCQYCREVLSNFEKISVLDSHQTCREAILAFNPIDPIDGRLKNIGQFMTYLRDQSGFLQANHRNFPMREMFYDAFTYREFNSSFESYSEQVAKVKYYKAANKSFFVNKCEELIFEEAIEKGQNKMNNSSNLPNWNSINDVYTWLYKAKGLMIDAAHQTLKYCYISPTTYNRFEELGGNSALDNIRTHIHVPRLVYNKNLKRDNISIGLAFGSGNLIMTNYREVTNILSVGIKPVVIRPHNIIVIEDMFEEFI